VTQTTGNTDLDRVGTNKTRPAGNDANNDEDNRSYGVGPFGKAHDGSPANIRYQFSLVSVESGSTGRFAFRHSFDGPIQLYGFGFKGTNEFHVRFEEFRIEEDGQWTNIPVGYCGTGARFYPIEPNRDYVFPILLWPYEKEGTKGIVELQGKDIHLCSAPFDTAQIKAMVRTEEIPTNAND
jgi:hypothetical protein